MKTCCPGCQTVFRISSEQLRSRAGKVRCGKCRTVFNAIDSLLDDSDSAITPAAADLPACTSVAPAAAPVWREAAHDERRAADRERPSPPETYGSLSAGALVESVLAASEPVMASADQRAGVDSLALPRETRQVPGYSRWLEGVMSKRVRPADRTMTKPFAIVASLLALTLAGQMAFHFRGAMAIAIPSLRPALAALSDALATDLPLPRRADLVSIETSDLQIDPGHDKLLALQATLRNRAAYAQAYPALELTLTDTNDKAIARRVLLPDEYLAPPARQQEAFPANADVDVRLWLEASEIDAAGYRLYVFYP